MLNQFTKHDEVIYRYYDVINKKPIIVKSLNSVIRILFAPKNSIVISNSKILRGIAKIRRIERREYSSTLEASNQYFALLDALSLLAQKDVPVFFFNRIGREKDLSIYSDTERERMRKDYSFPIMYNQIDKFEKHLQEIFGSLYSKGYVKKIGMIPQVIRVDNEYRHEDVKGEYINIVDGERITVNQPETYTRTIHMYGRCGVFGYAVEDKHTLPSLLQKVLVERGIHDVRVLNHGLWGGVDEYLDYNFLHDSIGMKKGDIIVFYRKHFDKHLINEFKRRGVVYKELTHEWHKRRNKNVTFYNQPGHMNAEGYKLVAELICEEIIKRNFKGDSETTDPRIILKNTGKLNTYLKEKNNTEFEKDIKNFVNGILSQYPLVQPHMVNGAIVMNCNPFTKGHRYLIEKAAKEVDRLYVFVVEEDKSFFRYEDRFEMVKDGTSGISNVVVVPSGRFIISAFTFPEYFMKDYVKEKNFDVSKDVRTFCKYIAPSLHIEVRFAGEEPFDPVTKNYNENMDKILPEYGMKFIEIPRLSIDEKRVINATKVRELLQQGNIEELKDYVPETTMRILRDRYIK